MTPQPTDERPDPTTTPPSGGPATIPHEVLTDEEVEILHGPATLVVQPRLGTLTGDARAAALDAAYRGLVARGIIDPPTAEALDASGDDPDVEVQVREDVMSLMVARQSARAVLCAARTTSASQDFWYAHVLGDVAVLELVTADGLHRFDLAPVADLPAVLVDAVTHPDTTDGSGPTLAVDDPTEPPGAMVDVLGAAMLRVDLVVRTPGDEQPELTGVFTGPGGAWLMSARLGDGQPVVVRPTTRTDLHALLHDLARSAVSSPEPAGVGSRAPRSDG